MKKLLLAIFCIFIASGTLFAAGTCWNGGYSGTAPWTVLDGEGGSPSAAQADVSYCVNTVAAASDVVSITATGTVTYTTTLTMTKGVKLIGPGALNLTIKNGTSSNAIIYSPTINTNDYFRLSGFTFDLNGKSSAFLMLSTFNAPFTPPNRVRVDHNTFINSVNTGGKGIWNTTAYYGVIDNNTFSGILFPITSDSGTGIDNWWSVDGSGEQDTFVLGSEKYMYIEDNNFINSYTITNGQNSARYVLRYNSMTCGGACGPAELHGHQSGGGGMDSCFGAELYGNHVEGNGYSMQSFFQLRSGQSRIFYNSSNTSSGNAPGVNAYIGTTWGPIPAHRQDEKITHNTYVWRNREDRNGALFKTSATGDSTISSDGFVFTNGSPDTITDTNNSFVSTLYSFQPTGTISNDTIWIVGARTSAGLFTVSGTQHVTTEDARGKSVTLNGGITGGTTVNSPRSGVHIFYDNGAYTGQPSSPGVGCGTELPATCTANEGYWVTGAGQSGTCTDLTGYTGKDHTSNIAGKLYKCVSTNTWSVDDDGITYTPYTYPHPLRDETADETAPELAEITAVSTPSSNQSAQYVFSSTETGTIAYGGDCGDGSPTVVTSTNTTVVWNLPAGTYSNCTITVTDSALNASTPLAVTEFVITPTAGIPMVGGGGMSFSGSLP